MPLYDYQCDECGTIIEDVFKRVTSEPDIDCPTCGAKVTNRADSIFSTNFKLTGKGWYKDGYSKENSKDTVSIK